jgi:hypothetical protein
MRKEKIFASHCRPVDYILDVSTVQEIDSAIPKLSKEDLAKLKQWMDDFFEDQLELKDKVKAKLDESRAEIAAGKYRNRQP